MLLPVNVANMRGVIRVDIKLVTAYPVSNRSTGLPVGGAWQMSNRSIERFVYAVGVAVVARLILNWLSANFGQRRV
jgi:hypothetical protein